MSALVPEPLPTGPADPARDAPRQQSWAALAAVAHGCTACPELALTRTQVVAGVAPVERPDLLLVGEAPGAQEDLTGVPFVGRSGQLLDQLLAEAGLRRERVAVTNVVKCRPPANRTPRRAEVQRCRPWLQRQVELLDPALVVAMGGTAAQWFAGPGARIAALRGSLLTYVGWPVLVTYHPSAAIRFGPRGAPLAALRADLTTAARVVQERA